MNESRSRSRVPVAKEVTDGAERKYLGLSILDFLFTNTMGNVLTGFSTGCENFNGQLKITHCYSSVSTA